MFFYSDTRLRPWILCLLAALTLPAAATAGPAACDAPSLLMPTDTHRLPEGAVAESHCYRLDLPSAGLLHLDLSVAGWSPSRARFSVVGAGGAAAALDSIERSPAEWLAAAPAGTYFLEVAAEDPLQPLPAYRLSSQFSAWTKSEDDGEIELDPETLKSEDDGEIELDPETSRAEPGPAIPEIACLDAVPEKSEDDGEIELDPETLKSEDDGEIELDPETSRAAGSGPLGVLCPGGDDHGDSRLCATPIGHRAVGELANGWGDDADVFRFRLCGWQTVEIATAGGADTFGELYDRAGQRLAGDDDGSEGGNFRLVRSLGPGTYFVRVEGMGGSGAYTLEVADAGR